MTLKVQKPVTGILAFLIVLLFMPLGHAAMILMEHWFGYKYVYHAAIVLGAVGLVLLVLGVKKKDETSATILGLFASVFIWTGWIEFSFVFIANKYNVAALMENGEVVTKPEYLVMPSSLGFLSIILIYYFFTKTNCSFFVWFQRLFKLTGDLDEKKGSKKNYALITAMEMIVLLWTFYLVLLFSYDSSFFGDRHPVTYIVAFGSLLWSLYLFIKLLKINKFAYAIRYAIPTVIIFWNFIEIIGRWNLMEEIWIQPREYWLEISLMVVVLTALFFIATFEKRRVES